MTNTHRRIRLGAFVQATGHHVSAWGHPASQADAGLNIAHYRDLARTAERGRLDLLFVADSPVTGDEDNSASLARNGKNAEFEPVTLRAALSQVTDRSLRQLRAPTRNRGAIRLTPSSPTGENHVC